MKTTENGLLRTALFDKASSFDADAFQTMLNRNKASVALFGAGHLGKQVRARLRRLGITPVAFLVDVPDGRHSVVEEIPVISPEEARQSLGQDVFVIVCVCNAHHRFLNTQKRFYNLGFRQVHPFTSLIHSYPGVFPPYYLYDAGSTVRAYAKDLSQTFTLLDDEDARQTLVSHLRFRVSNDYAYLLPPSADTYFPPFIRNKLNSGTHYIDCGAYNGDTLEMFLSRYKIPFKRVTAFEPDKRNYKQLQERVANSEDAAGTEINLVNKAVGYKKGTFAFSETGSEGSLLTKSGTVQVEVESLGEYIDSSNTYVKFDIEGAEPEAIRGAARAIAKYKPVLAVSAYHNPDDLWTIPALLKKINPDYKLSLTTEGEDGLGLVYYAY